MRDKIAGADIEIVACEPAACPTLTRGPYAYDFGDTGRLTPLVPMHTLGHDFVPPGIHAGGLRYHGAAPIVSQLVLDGLVRAEAFTQTDVFAAAIEFARSEAIIPAPESAHAIKGAIDAARRADEAGTEQVILFNLSGHGHFDMGAYDAYLARRARGLRAPRGRDRAGAPGDRGAAEAGRRLLAPRAAIVWENSSLRQVPRCRCTADSTMGRSSPARASRLPFGSR